MQARLTVGELARLVGLSKQTLIYYDREGVFRPSQVDPHNGYRYYTADQLEVLDTVLSLREMGVPLREIRAHMASRTAEETLALLREQQRAAAEKMRRWDLVRRRLGRKIRSLEALADPDGPWLVDLPAEPVALEPVAGRRGLLDVDVALKRLLRRAADEGMPHYYQLGDTVAAEDLAAGNFLHFRDAFLPLLWQWPGSARKPAGRYARCFHRGTYETMGRDYEALLARIDGAGLRPAGGSWEFCVLDCLASDEPEEYVTEIQIPVISKDREERA